MAPPFTVTHCIVLGAALALWLVAMWSLFTSEPRGTNLGPVHHSEAAIRRSLLLQSGAGLLVFAALSTGVVWVVEVGLGWGGVLAVAIEIAGYVVASAAGLLTGFAIFVWTTPS